MIEYVMMSVIVSLVIVTLLLLHQMQRMRLDHAKERSELLDRLMSKSLGEYKEHVSGEPPKFEPVDVDEEEEWAREIEMMKSG